MLLPLFCMHFSVHASCRKKNEQATFLEDLKDHIDDFVNAYLLQDHRGKVLWNVQELSQR
ncbi:hypothetical protein DVH24_041425 [Malus domestica]|uniref:Uncharacterized protein n=1 Tax=Malus domestica TaxID=3750 RepID=A0A498I936_MALDO|nr:hypothetical protein DVH24_041425 [Malus domestica]